MLPNFQNNKEAFTAFIQLHQQLVMNTALGIVQNTEDAEEITQDVFVEVFQQHQHFKGESSVTTWLYRITTNKCIDHIRKKKTKKRFAFITNLFHQNTNEPIHDAGHFVHPGVMAENKEKAAILFKAIEQLPDKQKTAYVLYEIENLSYAEIAEILNSSISSVESLLFRSRQGLRKILETFYKQQL